MSLELSKLNFKAKNQASGLSIHEPFANRQRQKEIHTNIQKERNDKIMAIFNSLNLDEEEKEFIDGTESVPRKSIFNKLDKKSGRNLDGNVIPTNFDDELDQMDFADLNTAEQQKVLQQFWAYIKDDSALKDN